jgi:HAD superfamily hydrolase (TIGR01509 family)
MRRAPLRAIRVLPDSHSGIDRVLCARRADGVGPASGEDGGVATRPTSSTAPPASFDALSARWRSAFHAAGAAIAAAGRSLPAEERRRLAKELAAEIRPTEALLEALARDRRLPARFLHLMVSPSEARRLLGLPPEVVACVFNLDGVLIPSAAIHAAAWLETFDEFILRRIERTGGHFAPFNPRVDYPHHLHARPRLDGVRAFLASRGIRLPEGDPSDAPGTETVHGLANRKNQALLRRLDEHPVVAFDAARSYLELAHDAGVQCAVVSASANTETILERTRLADLIDQRVDGNTMQAEHLRVKPAPDTLLAACRMLGVEPQRAAAFETTRAGVAAGRAAGFDLIVGVDSGDGAEGLRAEGADLVVSGVDDLLERRLAA